MRSVAPSLPTGGLGPPLSRSAHAPASAPARPVRFTLARCLGFASGGRCAPAGIGFAVGPLGRATSNPRAPVKDKNEDTPTPLCRVSSPGLRVSHAFKGAARGEPLAGARP